MSDFDGDNLSEEEEDDDEDFNQRSEGNLALFFAL